MDYQSRSTQKTLTNGRKTRMVTRAPLETAEDLSPCIHTGRCSALSGNPENPELCYELTRRKNLVAVITAETAVLGLGDIGVWRVCPLWKQCCLFKAFGDVDAIPLCVKSKDVTKSCAR